jgi:hypothetical protein
LNPDSAFEREAMSEEQTFRSEDMHSASEKAAALSAVRNDGKQIEAANWHEKRL